MRCFEPLGISELATEEEINSAFQAKNTALLESKDVLGLAAYEKKYKEICNARTECSRWRSNLSTKERWQGSRTPQLQERAQMLGLMPHALVLVHVPICAAVLHVTDQP